MIRKQILQLILLMTLFYFCNQITSIQNDSVIADFKVNITPADVD